MNALPIISHRLLASAVTEHRSIRAASAAQKGSVIIDCDPDWSAPSSGIEKSVPPLPASTARPSMPEAVISGSWPFFE